MTETFEQLIARQSTWSLPNELRRQAAANPSAAALQFEKGPLISYLELLQRVEALAANLLKLGLSRGERVALLMDNSAEAVVAWFAVSFAGGVEVPVNPALKGIFLQHLLENSGARFAIADGSLLAPLLDVDRDKVSLEAVICNGAVAVNLPWPSHSYGALAGGADECDLVRLREIEVRVDEPAAIMYTSGTTGPAKGVVMPHGQMYIWALHMKDALQLTSSDIYLVTLPLFHANAQVMQVFAAITAGAKIALYRRFSTHLWLDQAIECGATVSSLLGVMAQFIFATPEGEKDRKSKLSRLITIPLPAAIAHQFEERFGVKCLEGYGMTEVCLPMFRRLDDPLRPGSCGRVMGEWFEVAILDPETDQRVAPNTVGEIAVRPRAPFTMMLEYFRMPERTLRAWRNLWFHTGDSGRCDEEGNFYFVDRLQDRIRRRGENISSYELEAAASEYHHIVEAAAVAVPAHEGEDEIRLCLVTKDGALDFVDFFEHCKRRMPYFAVPRYYCVFSELPKTPNGKVLKRDLRDAQGLASWDRVAAGCHVGRDA